MVWNQLKTIKMRHALFMGMALTLILIYPQTISWADGPSVDTGKNNSDSPGINRPSSEWPPAGTTPKGKFVAGAFAGTWYSFVDNTAFTIVFEQEGQIIKGAHVAIYDYGRRVDSSVGGVSMTGTVMGSIAYLEWKSGLSPENGRATVEYMPGRPITLHWKVVDAPKKAEDQADVAVPTEVSYFLPASAFLIRK
jgi:hypothetical protein